MTQDTEGVLDLIQASNIKVVTELNLSFKKSTQPVSISISGVKHVTKKTFI